jgi:oxaloacetate decarboxylase alpha subunit
LAYIAEREDKPVGRPNEYDEFHFHHQMAGGAISNLRSQLETIGMEHRIDEILDEAGRVRADLGYPMVVSPFASYIVTQAVL